MLVTTSSGCFTDVNIKDLEQYTTLHIQVTVSMIADLNRNNFIMNLHIYFLAVKPGIASLMITEVPRQGGFAPP